MSDNSKIRLKSERLEDRDVPAANGYFAIASGAGGTPRVQVINSTSGAVIADFQAFESGFTGGVQTTVVDINNDSVPDLIVGAGNGGGPRVRVIDGRAFLTNVTASPIAHAPTDGTTVITGSPIIADFFAYEASQRGGVTLASGLFASNTNNDLVVGSGPGGGPRVRILSGKAITTQATTFTSYNDGDTIADFFAFESTFRDGVNVAASPPLGVNFSNLAVTPGIGGGPRVTVFNGGNIAIRRQTFVGNQQNDVLADFYSADPNLRTGQTVAFADFNHDGAPDLAVGSGTGGTPGVTIYSGTAILLQKLSFTGQSAGDVLDSFPVNNSGSTYTQAVNVGAAIDPSNPTAAILLVGAGGDGRLGQVQAIRYQTGAGFLTPGSTLNLTFDPNFVGGVFVSE